MIESVLLDDSFRNALSPPPCVSRCNEVWWTTEQNYNGHFVMNFGDGAKSLNLGPRVGVVFLPVNTVDATDQTLYGSNCQPVFEKHTLVRPDLINLVLSI